MRDDTWALLTTLNEADTIGRIVADLLGLIDGPGLCKGVMVVDAGSTDGTQEAAAEAGAEVKLRPGYPIRDALLVGWQLVARTDARYLIQLDAGGSHDPREALELLKVLEDSGADIVIGSRFRLWSRYFGRPWRSAMSQAAALACNVKTGAHLTDWTSGYRVFRVDALRRLVDAPYRASMHGWQIEVIGQALALGMLVEEAPICYRAGRSSFNGRIAREALRAWVRL